MPIAKVANEDIMTKLPEIGRGDGYSPGKIQLAVRNQAFDEIAVRVENIDEAMPQACHAVLPCIQHVELTAHALDIEGGIALWNAGIVEGAVQCGRSKLRIECLNGANVAAGASNGKGKAGTHRSPVDHNRASTANAVFAAEMCSG